MSRWGGGGEGKFLVPPPPPHQPSPVKYLITIQDGGIESVIYLAFRSKITAALQATYKLINLHAKYNCTKHRSHHLLCAPAAIRHNPPSQVPHGSGLTISELQVQNLCDSCPDVINSFHLYMNL